MNFDLDIEIRRFFSHYVQPYLQLLCIVLKDNISPHDENMQYLNLALKAHVDKMNVCAKEGVKSEDQLNPSSLKRDSSGQTKTSIPFGPYLIQVGSEEMAHKHLATNYTNTLVVKDNAPLIQNKTKPQPAATCEKEELRETQRPMENEIAGPGQRHISTNDVLDCLLHPDVIGMVSRLMMNRVKELNSNQIVDS